MIKAAKKDFIVKSTVNQIITGAKSSVEVPGQGQALSTVAQNQLPWTQRQNLPRGLHVARWDLGKGPRSDFYKAQMHQWAQSQGGRINMSHPFFCFLSPENGMGLGHLTKSPFVNGIFMEDAEVLPQIFMELDGRKQWVQCFFIPWNLSEPLPDPYVNVNFQVAVPMSVNDNHPRREYSYRLRVSPQHDNWLAQSSTRKVLADIVADSEHLPDYIKDYFSHE